MLKSIVPYLVLVGIPLAGLLWILEYYGARLDAPPRIDGPWAVEAPVTSCTNEPATELVFKQSGRYVATSLGSARGQARLDGTELHASLAEPEGPCGTIEIEGSFDEAIEHFTGRATATKCEACSVEFEARRSVKEK